MITRRKLIVGSAALAAAATIPALPIVPEVMGPWRPRVFWRTLYFDELQHAVDTMIAFLTAREGSLRANGIPEFGREERIMVVRGGGQNFRWTDELNNEYVHGWVNEGGVLIARVVACETMYYRGGGGPVTKVGLIWTSTGRGSA